MYIVIFLIYILEKNCYCFYSEVKISVVERLIVLNLIDLNDKYSYKRSYL
jgi:hypothetical protein